MGNKKLLILKTAAVVSCVVALGITGCKGGNGEAAAVKNKSNIEVSIHNAKGESVDVQRDGKEDIEAALGFELEWNRLDSKKASYICTYIKGLDFKKQDNYPQLMEQIISMVLTMRKVFPQFM